MASKLYDVLNDVNNNRLNLIYQLNRTGLNLGSDATLGAVAANVSACLKPNNVEELYPIPQLETNNPDEDPDLWHAPADWPDIRSIYEQYDDVEHNGKFYTPIYIALFSTELDTTVFYTRENYNVTLNEYCDRGKIQIGYTYASTSSSYRCMSKLVKTSDGGTVQVAATWDANLKNYSDREVSYTWDTTKDIILSDGLRLKYVVVYAEYDSGSIPNYWGKYNNFTGVDLYEALTDCHGVTTKNVNNSGVSEKNTGIRGVGYFKRMTHIPPRHEAKRRYWQTNNNLIFSDGVPEQIVIDQDPDYKWFGTDNKSILLYSYDIKYLKHNIPNYYTSASGASNSANQQTNAGLIYLSCPAVNSVKNSNLRYLYIDPEVQQTVDYIELGPSPQLRDTNLLENIKGLTGTTSLAYMAPNMANRNIVSFEHLELLNPAVRGALSNLHCRQLMFPKLQSITDQDVLWYVSGDYCPQYDVISFPELTTALTVAWIPPTRILELPKLKDASQVKPYPAGGTNTRGTVLMYLDVSGLETGTLTLSSHYGLKYIKFPEVVGFGDIYLYGCWGLSKEFILDLFNRLADVNDADRTYTLTLPNNLLSYNQFTEEELAIATNKGWVIK